VKVRQEKSLPDPVFYQSKLKKRSWIA